MAKTWEQSALAAALAATLAVVGVVGVGSAGGAEPVLAEPIFQAGAATADLTPGEGVSLDGPISKPGPVRGVHDRLAARALALRLGKTTAIIVINDMCMIDREVYEDAKRIVQREVGVAPRFQLMAATHTHAAPRVARISERGPDEAYRKFVSQQAAAAAIAAFRNLAPAKVGYASFAKPELIACRRSLCEAGSVGLNPFGEAGERVKSVAGASAAVIRAAGPVDPQFSVVSIQHASGEPLAVLGNFSVHYCGGYAGGMVSADYFGAFSRRVEEQLAPRAAETGKPPFVAMMSNGTSGDTGSFTRSAAAQPAWARIDHFGQLLADEAVRAVAPLDYQAPTALEVAFHDLELAVRKPAEDRVAWARQTLQSPPDAKLAHRWSRIYAQEALHLAQFPARRATPLQAIRIGDIGVAACPCEVFAGTGLAIKQASPLKRTFTIELANGYGGYLPDPQQHSWGGYETWPARSSHLEVDAEPKIRAELLRLLKETARNP